ncbi:uncharacterized protein LOC109601394 [Aethina tumida]|uniref:uncharacterized protein LOC109601394 n=1 Tax=Aethina tumida TaxID=116153 RepID=UPI00214761F2|nr:uncharacterized protein LOC109601394 [Aethina tumida]
MSEPAEQPFAQNIFELQCILQNINIRLCARIESGVKQLLAIITSDGEVVLHYTYGEMVPIVKRVPWFSDRNKVIQAVCFDPSATWLLVISVDGSLYIIPALSLVDKKQKIDCKWSLNDVTHFHKHNLTPNVLPTSIVWWQTLDSNQNALVGYENGAIVLISLTDGRYLGCCTITESVKQLCLCQDNSLDTVSLLINGISGQQWRLILEHHNTGYLWPPETSNADDNNKSRLSNLRQLGADKLQLLRQRFSGEGRSSRRDSQTSDSASESSHSHSEHSSGPEPLPRLCDTWFAPQHARNQHLFSAFYRPSSLLTIHAVDVESAPMFVHKLCPNTTYLLLTDKLIYTINEDSDTLSIISSQLSECRLEGDSEFNSDALVARFTVINEKILHVFKLVDLSSVRLRKKDEKKDKVYELPKTIDDINIRKPRIDTCVIVTNNSVYKLIVACSPVRKFVEYVTEENNLEKAEKISIIFGLNLQQLLECCGDLFVSRGSFHSGIILYKQAKVHLLKRVLKLAVSADCRTLLKFVHLCLSASKVDMSMPTKIHIGNLAVMAYTELILRFGGPVRLNNTKDFMNFLCFEEYYDQILAVNVACQAGHWNIVNLLAKSRGLQPEVVSALGQILQSARAPRPTDRDFLMALSEPCLTQSLLIIPQSSQVIFQYIRTNIDSFPLDVLQRLAVQLDPSQPSALPLVGRVFYSGGKKYSSSLDTTLDSIDVENPDRAVLTVKDMIETFLVVLVHLTFKTDTAKYELEFLDKIEMPDDDIEEMPIKQFPDLHPLSCGYEHTAVIRNSNVYTMGVSNSGCLGLGPLLTQSSPPRLVQTLSDLRVKVLSVACGRKHTLALTDHGVYAWGSNSYGQLGLGKFVQESPYPQILHTLAEEKIIDIAAGQYHSMGLTSSGKVYTWGWGIHGQLGHRNCDNQYYPKLMAFSHPIKQVAAGHAHSLVLTCEGKLFGFGSNIFGQLESCQIESNKSTTPVWVLLMPDIYTPIEKVSTAYFHNIAIRADQEVYTWGASPQEVRLFQSKNNNKNQQNGLSLKPPDSWKASVHVYSGINKRPIEQVSVGYRHSAILHNGKILWGKNKNDELSPPKMRDQDNVNLFTQRFLHVACGLDYTMAIDHTGKLLAWGNASMAQTILGKPFDENNKRFASMEGKVAVFKNTRRYIKFPNTLQSNSDNIPIEVPGLPTMAITFNFSDHKLLLSKRQRTYAIRKIENKVLFTPDNRRRSSNPLDLVQQCPDVYFGQKTLHYALELYYGLYDSENLLTNCFNMGNYQAASKIALLDGHYGDSLAFQLMALKEHMKAQNLNLRSTKNSFDNDGQIDLVLKSLQDDLNERNLLLHSSSAEKIMSSSTSPGRILSSSSSLDSIRQWGDDVEHQGGCESPCEMSEMGDIRQNMTQYVQAVTSTESSPPISCVSKLIADSEKAVRQKETDGVLVDSATDTVIKIASTLVEFYITKVHVTENHILMQNILLKCIEFWLSNNLPVAALENVLLKNMDKYFYPLSILLFCKNYGNNDDEIIKENDSKNSACFLKEFSTKFCLQLCSMVLENVNKS